MDGMVAVVGGSIFGGLLSAAWIGSGFLALAVERRKVKGRFGRYLYGEKAGKADDIVGLTVPFVCQDY